MTFVTFEKYEGLGNDFILVEAEAEAEVSDDCARAWCDRRRGIGADGVLVVLPARTPGPVARMRVINADGSIAEMCGNGLRCVVLHLAAKAGRERGEMAIETDAGVRRCAFERDNNQAVITADMGTVKVNGELSVSVDDLMLPLIRVDAGNPHAVSFLEMSRADFEYFGPRLSAAHEFAGGMNIEIAHVDGGAIHVLVWERGAGATLACGTGACAVVAAARAKGLVDAETVRVVLPGGDMFIHHDPATGATTMRGPARRVFSGRVARA